MGENLHPSTNIKIVINMNYLDKRFLIKTIFLPPSLRDSSERRKSYFWPGIRGRLNAVIITTLNAKSDSYKPKCQYANINTTPYEPSLWGPEAPIEP